jgi:hypothetical protein
MLIRDKVVVSHKLKPERREYQIKPQILEKVMLIKCLKI